jgi:hypothetical protein
MVDINTDSRVGDGEELDEFVGEEVIGDGEDWIVLGGYASV